jgi:hypothetical protein
LLNTGSATAAGSPAPKELIARMDTPSTSLKLLPPGLEKAIGSVVVFAPSCPQDRCAPADQQYW